MKRLLFILVFSLFAGCASVSSVERNIQSINYDDGISKKEALAIGRKAVINSKLNDYYKIWLASIYDRGEYFLISIPSFALNDQECILVIEKEHGEILAFWQASDREEITREVTPTRSIEEWKELNKFWP